MTFKTLNRAGLVGLALAAMAGAALAQAPATPPLPCPTRATSPS